MQTKRWAALLVGVVVLGLAAGRADSQVQMKKAMNMMSPAGANVLANPGFETPGAGGQIAAGWIAYNEKAGAKGGGLDARMSTKAHSGSHAVELGLHNDVTLRAGETTEVVVKAANMTPAQNGQQWTLSGWVYPSVRNLPSGVTADMKIVAAQFYSNGTHDDEARLDTSNLATSAQMNTWSQQTVGPKALPTPSGKNQANLLFQISLKLTNNSGSMVTLKAGQMECSLLVDDVSLMHN